MIKISVIIPAYNVEEYIEESLRSVMNQTLKEIEIICIDDGSTDNTLHILNNLKDEDDRISIISQENNGLSSARNQGIRHSNGKYIIYLDADDKLSENALKELFYAAEEYKYDILYFSADVFASETNDFHINEEVNRLNNYYTRDMNIYEPVNGVEAFINMYKIDKYLVSACLQMIRKQYLLDSKVLFCEGLLHEDNLYTFFTLINAEKVGCIDKAYYIRRVRSNSIMTSQSTHRNIQGLFLSYDKIHQSLDFLKMLNLEALNYVDLYLKRLIDESIRIYYVVSDEEKNKFFNIISERQKRLFLLNKELGDARWLINQLECQKRDSINENEHIIKSFSYKIGRLVTYLPRMCRRKIRK